MEQPVKNSSKKVWIIVGGIVGLCLLGIIALIIAFSMMGRLVSKSIGTDPGAAAKVAHEITDYDLPAGYAENMSMNILTTRMVMIGPSGQNPGPVMMLAEFGEMGDTGTEEMTEQIQRSFQQRTGQQYGDVREVERRPLIVRGVETEAVISEGSAAYGVTVWQLIVIFPGKKGTAMLMVSGIREQWDDDLIFDFIASFR